MKNDKIVALEGRLKECPDIITLGVKPNFSDYNEYEAKLIRESEKIYYPTSFYADLFDSIGKKTFPSYNTYKYVQDKIKQTTIFQILKIPHPATRFFYGKRQKSAICQYFKFPFIAKIPRGSALGRGVFLINNQNDLDQYCNTVHTAYIQEYIPIDRDIRVVIIGKKVVHAYWRIACIGEFRNNVALGATINLGYVPIEALDLALYTTQACGWDDVGLDICTYKGKFYVIEANMRYGKEGFRIAGMNYIKIIEQMIKNKEI